MYISLPEAMASSPFPNTFAMGVLAAAQVIDAHIPSLTEEAEARIEERHADQYDGLDEWDWADFAVRECACGKILDGFYAYVDHLHELLKLKAVES